MNFEHANPDFWTALSAFQGEVEDAKRDETNLHFGKTYADLASARRAIREPLAKHGLAVTQGVSTQVVEGKLYAAITTMLAHKSGGMIWEVLSLPVVRADPQGIGSAITYGRRYGLMAITGLASEDDDGNAASAAPEAARARASNARVREVAGKQGRAYLDEDERDAAQADAVRSSGTISGRARAQAPKWATKPIGEQIAAAMADDEAALHGDTFSPTATLPPTADAIAMGDRFMALQTEAEVVTLRDSAEFKTLWASWDGPSRAHVGNIAKERLALIRSPDVTHLPEDD